MNIYSLSRGHLFRRALHTGSCVFVLPPSLALEMNRTVPDCITLAPFRDGGERESASGSSRLVLSLFSWQQDTSHPPGKTPTRGC